MVNLACILRRVGNSVKRALTAFGCLMGNITTGKGKTSFYLISWYWLLTGLSSLSQLEWLTLKKTH